jgi:hypothetical protein
MPATMKSAVMRILITLKEWRCGKNLIFSLLKNSNPHIRVLLADNVPGYIRISLTILFEHTTINTKSPAWYKSRMFSFVKSLHYCTTWGVITFRMPDIWHNDVYNQP